MYVYMYVCMYVYYSAHLVLTRRPNLLSILLCSQVLPRRAVLPADRLPLRVRDCLGRQADQDGGGRPGGEAGHIHIPAGLHADLEGHHRVQNVRLGVRSGADRVADHPTR